MMTPTKLESLLGRAIAPRMWVWLWLSVALVIGVWWVADHMIKVLLWKVVILTVCSFLGDKIARGMENSNERPHELLREAAELRAAGFVEAARELWRRADGIYLRRALIISACVIAGALGT
jgi:hypothetical protein